MRWSSVNPQGPHATRARGRLHGTPHAAAAPATMLQRLAVLRRKGCHSVVVPRRRGRTRSAAGAAAARARARKTNELGCLTRPAATDLDPEDNEAASARLVQLRVGVAALAIHRQEQFLLKYCLSEPWTPSEGGQRNQMCPRSTGGRSNGKAN